MVISEWQVDNQPNQQGEYISIRGQAPGSLSWILSILGVERGVKMSSSTRHVRFQEGDLGGSSTRIIQMDSICSTYFGYKKPLIETIITLLILGPLLAFLGQLALKGFMGYLIGAGAAIGIAALYYALNKQMTVGLVEYSGVVNQVVFKRSVLEGVKLDESSAAYACDILQWLMDNARTEGTGGTARAIQTGHI